MGVAEDLRGRLFSWVNALRKSADSLNELSYELERHRRNVEASALGLSEMLSGDQVKAQQLEDMEKREKEIQTLVASLAEEGRTRGEDYVVDQILRVMARHHNLELNDQIGVHNLLCKFSGKEFSVLKSFIDHQHKNKPGQSEEPEEEPVEAALGSEAGELFFSFCGLTEKLKNLDTDHSLSETVHSLRQNAEALRTMSDRLNEEKEELKEAFEKLAVVKRCIKKKKRYEIDMEKLIGLVKHVCDDETLQWLSNTSRSESKAFFKLVDLFHLMKETIYEETKKKHSDNIDITFVAHGSITVPMIPAGRLLPLPTITDVVLHCPWNCLLSADAAYGVATGLLKPEDKKFCCLNKKCCLPNKNHQPKELEQWNSMREAKERKLNIPNITVSPVKRQTDRAWRSFQFLKTEHGEPETNHIVILYTVPGKVKPSDRVPLCAVTLALSLVLFFSRFKATVHLAACLGDRSEDRLEKAYLDQQYAWANDNTGMTCKRDLFPDKDSELYGVMETVFGSFTV